MITARCLGRLAALAVFLLAPTILWAQPFGEPGPLDPAVPSPDQVLGYPLGAKFTPHYRILAYLDSLDRASNRVMMEQYGTTEEGRPLVLLAISDPQNLARRAEIQAAYLQLADPRRANDARARKMADDLPVAVWLSFNIHGNEASSSEAAMGVAYRLAAAQDPPLQDLLKHVVVLIDPCLNPDGRDRYVQWINGVEGSRPDPLPASREHHEPWPGGRFNHYLFDLNRDWAWLTQAESKARVHAYLTWRPQVHVDFHEMYAGSSYFFFPPEKPIHAMFPPQVLEWGRTFGRGNAAAFDARGWPYYTAESFDLYYPSYGDSWPTFQGAIGMTYEQAGHSAAGLAFRRSDGDTLTLAERAHHHYVAALATVATAVEHRHDRLMDFHRFFVRDRASGPQAYLFPPGDDPPRTAELMTLLMTHGAEVYASKSGISAGGLHSYDGKASDKNLPAGTYVVPLDQPLFRFLQAVLEPSPALPDTFFYDVSAWALPYAFGVRAYWSERKISGSLERLQAPPHPAGELVRPDAGYAYLIPWSRNDAALAASSLLAKNVRLHFIDRKIQVGSESFSEGTLIAFRNDNDPRLPALMKQVVDETGTRAVGVSSGLTDSGPDLGSDHVRSLKQPRVALLSGDAVGPTSLGACWYLLDRVYDVPHSLVQMDDLSESVLSNYTVLVFPDDEEGGSGYSEMIDSTKVSVIKRWVQNGGVFVGLGGGAFFAAADKAGLSSVKSLPDSAGKAPAKGEDRKTQELKRRLETGAEREHRERIEEVPGTIFRIKMDPQHPLAFGYSGETQVFKMSRQALDLGPEGTNVAWFTASAKVSGYASRENVERFKEKPFLIDEPRGRGHVVLYVEDPNFRVFWYGLNRMFLNSIYFLPSLVSR
jgi:zinc carboxypeptidase/biotin protein ligase-like protein